MIVNTGLRRNLGSGRGGRCTDTITTPVDSTVTVGLVGTTCSTGAIEVDSVAAGNGIVVVNGIWRLS